jgi:hypothetical protein
MDIIKGRTHINNGLNIINGRTQEERTQNIDILCAEPRQKGHRNIDKNMGKTQEEVTKNIDIFLAEHR